MTQESHAEPTQQLQTLRLTEQVYLLLSGFLQVSNQAYQHRMGDLV